MDTDETRRVWILRFLEGKVSAEERARVVGLLRADAEARRFLRDVAEQSVMITDIERSTRARETVASSEDPVARSLPAGEPRRSRGLGRGLVALVGVAVLAMAVQRHRGARPEAVLTVAKATGSSQFIGAAGQPASVLRTGTRLRAGDTVATRSCDAWIELRLGDGSSVTLAGHSALRVLGTDAGTPRFSLLEGSLWRSPSSGPRTGPVWIGTPTVEARMEAGQFDVQTTAAETKVRVNQGSGRIRQVLDGASAAIGPGQQIAASFSRKEPLSPVAQPAPVDRWACDLGKVPEVVLGRWLPPTGQERARLAADPLLWPIGDGRSVMLYAVAIAAWKSSDRPVVLHGESRLRFRGRTEAARTVRFGFSSQRMQGAFAGKFEIDVPSPTLGPAGATWEVDLPLASFRPLQPQLAGSPEGLELTDVYALTLEEDVGLEINHIELVPDVP